MLRAWVPSVVLGAALATVACRPVADVSNEPGAHAAGIESETAALNADESGSGAGGGFLVMLQSSCGDTWNGVLVRAKDGDASSGSHAGGFEVSHKKIQELRLQPGDALLLTSPHGGILDVHFDGIIEGYGARVEVNSECSGIKRTLVPHDALAKDVL